MFSLVTFLMWFCWLSYFAIQWLVALGPFPGRLHDSSEAFFLYWAAAFTIFKCLFDLLLAAGRRALLERPPKETK